MRKIQTSDVFHAIRLIEKSGLKEELVPLIKDIAVKGTDALDSGILGILTALFSIARMEQPIYEWLAPIVGQRPEEISELALDELVQLLEELTDQNDLRAFFKAVSGLAAKK
ncbi:MAG: hypothetical protein IJJ75_07905 [Firmicutes bacterium]|nr:hypothetical protein [Bacillota bacterium]